MNFDLTPEQYLLQESVSKMLASHYGFEQRKKYIVTPERWSRDIWATFAELGLLGLPFSIEDGGFGAGGVEMMVVAEQIGAALVVEPWLSTIAVGGGFLRYGGTAETRQRIIPDIVAGHTLLAFAHTEPQSGFDFVDIDTSARREGSEWIINGRKDVVLNGATADYFVITARTSGERGDRTGISLFLVSASEEGVTVFDRGLPAGASYADVVLQSVRVVDEMVLGDIDAATSLIDLVVDGALAALAAEAVGCMQAAISLTVNYLKTRRQFGKTIGSYQALQHRAADMVVGLEQSRSMAMLAAIACSMQDPVQRRRQVAAVKIEVSRHARFVAQQTVQLHGGIGMTMEYAVGHYLRRLTAIEQMFGDRDYYLSQLSAMGGLDFAG